MITAAASASTEIAEELLSYFVDIGNKECFAALLYICFDLLRSDIVEELSWQHALNDFYMPYRIQVQRSLVDKVSIVRILLFSKSYHSYSWHSWRRRSRNDPRKTHKRSKLRQKRQSSIQAVMAGGCSSRTGRWIDSCIARCYLGMSRIVGQAPMMMGMAPVRPVFLTSAHWLNKYSEYDWVVLIAIVTCT